MTGVCSLLHPQSHGIPNLARRTDKNTAAEKGRYGASDNAFVARRIGDAIGV
jgi:hypothetical protein